jgi:hypothetical protein
MAASRKTAAKASKTFSAEERAAMREAAKERKAGKGDGTSAVLEKIADMQGTDRKLAERLHAIITSTAPDLTPRTWYGMPAYAKDDKVVCFFKPAQKFKNRYATLGFSDRAQLDDGSMWPTEFALKELSPAEEKRIVALLEQAVG